VWLQIYKGKIFKAHYEAEKIMRIMKLSVNMILSTFFNIFLPKSGFWNWLVLRKWGEWISSPAKNHQIFKASFNPFIPLREFLAPWKNPHGNRQSGLFGPYLCNETQGKQTATRQAEENQTIHSLVGTARIHLPALPKKYTYPLEV